MKTTKVQLEKEIEKLRGERDSARNSNATLIEGERDRRREITKLLEGTYHGKQVVNLCMGEMVDFGRHRERDILSWPEIYFALGELYADANLQCLGPRIDDLSRENAELKHHLERARRGQV